MEAALGLEQLQVDPHSKYSHSKYSHSKYSHSKYGGGIRPRAAAGGPREKYLLWLSTYYRTLGALTMTLPTTALRTLALLTTGSP